ncbi:ABC transporter ATP-binding protein [Curtobacterium sp. RRHDQ10]|uniref:ABC transporter ATP-binding protein n=1 Tax=Curtobacterium phyllosphaerae TaxID=3413379 RepID=UPI003BF1A002
MTDVIEKAADVILHVAGISKRYGKRTVLDDFSLQLATGQVCGLLGSNGSGKSTALHVIAGLVDAEIGDVWHADEHVTSKKSRQKFGFAPDDLPVPSSLTGREFLDVHASLRREGPRGLDERLAALLELSDALPSPMASYSHGMKRKLQLIAALAHRPSLLILDEPFRGLDPDASMTLQDLIAAFAASGGAVLLATHDLHQVSRHCDTLVVLHDGMTTLRGTVSELESIHGSIENVFLEATGKQLNSVNRRKNIQAMFEEEGISIDRH